VLAAATAARRRIHTQHLALFLAACTMNPLSLSLFLSVFAPSFCYFIKACFTISPVNMSQSDIIIRDFIEERAREENIARFFFL
jgi:hypothetical protein